MRTERGLLPEDRPERVATRLGLAVSALEREDSAAASSTLEAYMDDEEERITKVLGNSPDLFLTMPSHTQGYTMGVQALLPMRLPLMRCFLLHPAV